MTLLLGALVAFYAANLIHNRFGLDPAVIPASVFAAVYLWRRHRGWLWAAAAFIALPSFMFLKWSSLTNPGDLWPFLNHAALLAGGVLAIACVARSVRR
jgi:hypothetical protein